MRPSESLAKHRDQVLQIILQNKVENPRIIGSMARGEDTFESDIDLLVDTTDETSLLDLGEIQYKLSELLGCKVDVVTSSTIPERWKSHILKEAKPLGK